ncbi:MAG: AMP-binding protein [Oscillochloris sp.]|nr:AMP-binding protein [Oscillochloris sp.]
MLFLNRLFEQCRATPDRPAITLLSDATSTDLSYDELEAVTARAIGFLQRHGIAPGDRVALQLPRGVPFIALHLATLRLGAISLPLNPTYPPDELAYFLRDSAARLLAVDASAAPDVEWRAQLPDLEQVTVIAAAADPAAIFGPPPTDLPPLPADPDRTALMIYTSGTTGRPKGAEISHANLSANLDALQSAWGWRSDDVLLHVLPIFHVHGLIVALHGALHAGAHTIMLLRFTPELALQTMVERRCTVFMAVPTIHRRLVELAPEYRYDLSHMRLLTSGSDRLPDDLFSAFQQRYGHTLLERYGMTETGMNLSNPLAGERRVGSVGLPLPGVEARIVDPASGAILGDNSIGELQICGPHVFKGYWRNPEQTRPPSLLMAGCIPAIWPCASRTAITRSRAGPKI